MLARHTLALSLGLLVALPACKGLKKKIGGDDEPAASASAGTASKNAPPPEPVTSAPKGHTIEGIGTVPAWANDPAGATKCTPSPAAQAKFKALEKGDDAAVIAGTADIDAIVKEVGADSCFATRKGLAEALNNGGYKRYGAKKFDEASRYWRAALAARPAFLLSRYNLACGLALAGKGKDAVTELSEIARASNAGDATAVNFLEKAKSDADLKTVRDDPAFKEAVKGAQGALVGPRKGASEPEVGAKALPLLPDDFRKVNDPTGTMPGGVVTFKPAVVNIWTWRPDASNELVVTTITDDPAMLGKPRGDMSFNYGGIAVFKRDGEKLTILVARKTGDSPPAVAAGRNNTVVYSFEQMCGTLSGTLTFTGGHVDIKEKTCQDLGAGPPTTPTPAMATKPTSATKTCKPGEIIAADECVVKCDPEKPKCPAGKKCDIARFRNGNGDMVAEHICQ